MAQIKWTEPALNDIDEVAEYIAIDKPGAAKKLVKEIFKTTRRLKNFPESGRRPPELQDTNCKKGSGSEVSPRNSQIKQFTMAENWLIDILIFYHRSYALRGNASRDALRPQRLKIPTRATRHSHSNCPRQSTQSV